MSTPVKRVLDLDARLGPAGPPPRTHRRRGRDLRWRGARIFTSAGAVFALVLSSFLTLTSCSAAQGSSPPAWHVVTSPSFGSGGSRLTGVTAVAPNDFWAVGYYRPLPQENTQPLIEHWDGKYWTTAPSPNFASELSSPSGYGSLNVLSSVAAVSASDIWAVGQYGPASSASVQPLIEHWDGTSWQTVPSPSQQQGDGLLNAVAAVSTSDVWAVGQSRTRHDSSYRTLIEHWDGTSWKTVPSANYETSLGADSGAELTGVAAVSASDIWAVGDFSSWPTGQPPVQTVTLIEHWDGTSWKRMTSPNQESLHYGPNNELTGVAAVSASDVWAVGEYSPDLCAPASCVPSSNYLSQTLIEHWNGTNWKIVPSPNKGGNGHLNGVGVISASNIWAVGGFLVDSGAGPNPRRTLAEQWDGTGWNIISCPSVSGPSQTPIDNALQGVAADSAGALWAVGAFGDFIPGPNGPEQTLVMQRS
jgi:hypothetical protein